MPYGIATRDVIRKLIVVIMFTAVVMQGCGTDAPIRIGFIGSITGRMADIGMSGRNAVQLAVDQCNEQGGIHGRRVELIIRDDQQNSEIAVTAVQELTREKVAAIIGPMASNTGMAVVPYLNAAHIPAVGPTVTTTELSGLDDYFFRVCTTSRAHAEKSAAYQLRSNSMHRISITYDDNNRALSRTWIDHFNKVFTAGGGKILKVVQFNTGENPSFSKIADELTAPGPDGILIIANSTDSAMLCQQIRKVDALIKITSSHWAGSQRFLEMGGNAVEGVTLPVAFDRNSRAPRYQAFKKAYTERYLREPGFAGAYAYDAAQVILTALQKRKPEQSVKEAILSLDQVSGLQFDIRFDAYGDITPVGLSMRIVENKKFVALE